MNPKDIPAGLRFARAFIKHWIPVLIPAAVLGLATVLYLHRPAILEDLQLKVFDTFQRLRPRRYQPVPVRIVDLDDETLAKMGQWPWPRTQVAKLVDRLNELGASVIAFDMIFAEPDRTSPSRILPLWVSTAEFDAIRPQLEKLPDHDQVFAASLARANVVAGFFLTSDPRSTGLPAKKSSFAVGSQHGDDDPLPYLRHFKAAVTNLPEIEAAAAGNGHFNLTAEHGSRHFQRGFDVEVAALPFEYLMRRQPYAKEQIA